jgi:nucleoside-diphosphate-sugar epimerase
MNKKILVTGSEGFIGGKLVQKLEVLGVHEISTFDIQDGDICTGPLPFTGIDHVIHLAARTFVPDSWTEPRSFYMTNIQGTANILDFCHQQKSSLIFISAYVYGKPEYLPIDEDHPLAPNNPYMHSKVMAESLCGFYTDNFKVPVTILRPFNIMGPGQRKEFLIPQLVGQLLDPESDEIHVKDLVPKRDFLHLDDLLDAIIAAISADNPAGTFNVGSGESFSVEQIIEFMMDISGIRKKVITEKQVRKNEIPDVRADISRIKSVLGWEPRISFRGGLERIIKTCREDGL